jgi:hypothetical protein
VAAALILPSGTGGPTVVEAAQLSDLPATQERVPIDPANPAVLAEGVEGVPFPNLRPEFGWQPAGSRTDELDGRSTTTVFYEKDGNTLAYTIVGGDALDAPDGTVIRAEGTPVTVFQDGGRLVATWEREGNTCVLSGDGVEQAKLAELAGWTGKGALSF